MTSIRYRTALITLVLVLVGSFLVGPRVYGEQGASPTDHIAWPARGSLRSATEIASFIESQEAWTDVKSRYPEVIEALATHSAGAGKYFDVHTFLRSSAVRWKTIEKHRPDLVTLDTTVLDVGTGFGYFPLIGKLLHGLESIDATDAPGVKWHDLYSDVTKVLGVSTYDWFIRRFERVSLANGGKRYDLVTAYMVVFDHCDVRWGEREWRFFLADVRTSLLNEGGTVILGFSKPRQDDFMPWAKPLGAQFLGKPAHCVVIVPWEALERMRAEGLPLAPPIEQRPLPVAPSMSR